MKRQSNPLDFGWDERLYLYCNLTLPSYNIHRLKYNFSFTFRNKNWIIHL